MNKIRREIGDRWIYFGVLIIGALFLYRIIDGAKMIWIFPLSGNHDLPAYMSLLHLSSVYGYGEFVDLWFNGFYMFKAYFPGWFYFTLPFYLMTGNIGLATYVSFILIYLIILFLIFYFCKRYEISFWKRICMFVFFAGNPVALGYIWRLGRVTEFFSWMLFILYFFLILKYKDKKLDRYFWLIFLINIPLLLSHYSGFIVGLPLIVSLALVRRSWREYSYLGVSILIFFALISFWLVPYYQAVKETPNIEHFSSAWILSKSGEWIYDKLATWATTLIFGVVLFYYLKDREFKRNEILFYTPYFLIAALLFFRILPFVPVLNRLTPDTYNILFIFLSLFLFFQTDFYSYQRAFRKVVKFGFILLPIIGVLLTLYHVSLYPEHSELEKEIISLFSDVDGKLYIAIPQDRNMYMFYAYATTFYNISSSEGGVPALTSKEIDKLNRNLNDAIMDKDCERGSRDVNELGLENLIGYGDYCETIEVCGFNKEKVNGEACLFKIR